MGVMGVMGIEVSDGIVLGQIPRILLWMRK